jgi:hypothetical protein
VEALGRVWFWSGIGPGMKTERDEIRSVLELLYNMGKVWLWSKKGRN